MTNLLSWSRKHIHIILRHVLIKCHSIQFKTQSRQSARLFLQSSELGIPHLLTRRRDCPPGSGHPLLRERGWGVTIPTRGQTLWYSRHICTLWFKRRIGIRKAIVNNFRTNYEIRTPKGSYATRTCRVGKPVFRKYLLRIRISYEYIFVSIEKKTMWHII